MKPIKKISILIIEDNRLFRQGISAMINEQPDFKVIASISGVDKSLSNTLKFKPDIILIDLGLRSQNSLNVVKSLKKNSSGVKIIVMDLLPAHADILEFVKAGVSGFILKDARVHEFLKTVRSVAAGEKVLPTHLTDSLFTQIVERAVNGTPNADLKQDVQMTKRERQVIELISDGLTNKEIGQILHLSPYTVKSHVHNIMEKMTLHTRIQIALHTNKSKEFKDTADSVSLLDN